MFKAYVNANSLTELLAVGLPSIDNVISLATLPEGAQDIDVWLNPKTNTFEIAYTLPVLGVEATLAVGTSGDSPCSKLVSSRQVLDAGIHSLPLDSKEEATMEEQVCKFNSVSSEK